MLYKLVFHFIIPVYKTTRRVKQGFKEMNEKMRQHTERFNQQPETAQPKKGENISGDYIDYEEVKN